MSRPPDDERLTAIVLAYGDSPYLAGCLRSLSQQICPVRLIVSTSTPSDFVARAARDHGAELLVNPRRTDIAGDWNFALVATDCRFVTLAHQDDRYDRTFSSATLEAFAQVPDAALCFTGYQEIDDAGANKSSKISRVKHLIELLALGGRRRVSGAQLRAYLSFGNPLPCSSVTFDRLKLTDFRFSGAYASNLDWDAWWRLCSQGAIFVRVPDRLVGRRHNPLTATSSLIREGRRQVEDREMFRRLWPTPIGEAIAFLYRAGY